MRKRLVFAFLLLLSICISLHAQSLNIMTLNPDNPFNLSIPSWLNGYWEDEEGFYHMQITEDSIYTDILQYRSGRSSELTYSMISELWESPCIYDFRYNAGYSEGKDYYMGYLKKKIDGTFFNGIFSSLNQVSLYPKTREDIITQIMKNAGIDEEAKAEEIEDIIERQLQGMEANPNDYKSILNKCDDYEWLSSLLQYLLKNKESFVFTEFKAYALSEYPDIKYANEFIQHINIKEEISYPYYGISFFYDDIEFAIIEMRRSNDEISFYYQKDCYYDNEWDDTPKSFSLTKEKHSKLSFLCNLEQRVY